MQFACSSLGCSLFISLFWHEVGKNMLWVDGRQHLYAISSDMNYEICKQLKYTEHVGFSG